MTIINAFQLMMSYVRARQVLSEMVSIDAKSIQSEKHSKIAYSREQMKAVHSVSAHKSIIAADLVEVRRHSVGLHHVPDHCWGPPQEQQG